MFTVYPFHKKIGPSLQLRAKKKHTHLIHILEKKQEHSHIHTGWHPEKTTQPAMSSPQTGDSNPQLKHVFSMVLESQSFNLRIWEGQCVTLLEDLRGFPGRLLLIGAGPKGCFCYSSWWFQPIDPTCTSKTYRTLHVSSFNYLVLDIYIYK